MPRKIPKSSEIHVSLASIKRCLNDTIDSSNNFSFITSLSKFLQSHDSDLEEVKNFSKLLSKLNTFNAMEKIRENNSISFKKSGKYRLKKKMGQGSYGIVYKIERKKDGQDLVLKLPIVTKSNSIITSFMEECITHMLLVCFYPKTDIYSDYLGCPFPKIIKITKGLKGDIEVPLCIMEYLDINFYSYIRKILSKGQRPLDIEKKINSILFQVCYHLSYLQASFKFMHRDLHSQNIMLKKEKNGFGGDYRAYIIDLGMCCAQLDSCCGIKNPVFGSTGNQLLEGYNICMYNKSQDLRLLIADIYFAFGRSLPINIYNYFESIISKYKKSIDRFMDDDSISSKSHYFYQQTINNIDPDFFPTTIMEHIINFNKTHLYIP